MKINDFTIGMKFFGNAGFQWLCTDKGSRTISAIFLDPNRDVNWFQGPPYNLDEIVFDEYDMLSCYTSEVEMIKESISSLDNSSHPGFDSKDVFKMIKDKNRDYPIKNVLKRDRVGIDGSIYHPYSAEKINGEWIIKVFEIFSKQYLKINENDFIKLSLASEKDMLNRKNKN